MNYESMKRVDSELRKLRRDYDEFDDTKLSVCRLWYMTVLEKALDALRAEEKRKPKHPMITMPQMREEFFNSEGYFAPDSEVFYWWTNRDIASSLSSDEEK